MTTLEVLQKARSFIADPLKWTTGWGFMTQNGEGHTCAVGAVRTAVGLSAAPLGDDVLSENKEAGNAVKKLASVIGQRTPFGVVRYNDHNSHECVIAMFDAAIEREKQKAE